VKLTDLSSINLIFLYFDLKEFRIYEIKDRRMRVDEKKFSNQNYFKLEKK
jgi:hypothetical protein